VTPYLTFAILLTLGLVQSTVVPRIYLLGVHPDLMLVVVTSWSLLRGWQEGMLWALIGGVIMDVLSGAPFGVYTLSLLLAAFLAGLGQRNVFRFDLLIPVLVIPVVSLVYNLSLLALLSLLRWPVDWRQSVTRIILPSLVVNSLFMPIIYLPLRALDRRTRREEIAW
jgi:rod shape-determining protein MreD